MFGWLARYQRNWRLLREATDAVGREVEAWSYETLDRAAEHQPSIERVVGGRTVSFQIDCVGVGPDGELRISIDAHGGPPTLLGIRPSYVFVKRRDGTVVRGQRSTIAPP